MKQNLNLRQKFLWPTSTRNILDNFEIGFEFHIHSTTLSPIPYAKETKKPNE